MRGIRVRWVGGGSSVRRVWLLGGVGPDRKGSRVGRKWRRAVSWMGSGGSCRCSRGFELAAEAVDLACQFLLGNAESVDVIDGCEGQGARLQRECRVA